MDKLNFQSKNTGDVLQASEWNALANKTDEIVDAINNGGSGGGAIDTQGVVSVNSKGNTTISSTKHINIEPAYVEGGGEGTYGDVQIKPGDDITLESHHRALSKQDEITVKTSNGQSGNSKAPVKLQVIASDMTLSTKGKKVEQGSNDSSNVMNINVTTGEGKGYLKVRAQAIDLRCEEHGGIALQPKGEDSSHNENKIKFEHGGGDGLEFGTFNTEKTSIFTDEYRFNKDGVWKMATRQKVASDKAESGDATTQYKYVKQSDDFYDIISSNDAQCTTKDIIKTANALNGVPTIHTKITDNGNLEIATVGKFVLLEKDLESNISDPISDSDYIDGIHDYYGHSDSLVVNGYYDVEEISGCFNTNEYAYIEDPMIEAADDDILYIAEYVEGFEGTSASASPDDIMVFKFKKVSAPSINIESGSELKLKGILDFGSTFNFGETDKGIEVQYKLTKKNAEKDCGILKVVAVNNHASNNITIDKSTWDLTTPSSPVLVTDTATVAPGERTVVAEASLYDIIKLTNYMKANNQGPWATAL